MKKKQNLIETVQGALKEAGRVLAILPVAAAMTFAACNNGGPDIGEPNVPTTPTEQNWGYDKFGNKHYLVSREICRAECLPALMGGILSVPPSKEQVYIDALWASWYNGGSYHDLPTAFVIGSRPFSADISKVIGGSTAPKAPCFRDIDRQAGENAALGK